MNAAPALTADLLQNIDAADIALLPRDRQERFAALLATLNRRASQRQFFDYFPDVDNYKPDGSIMYARDRYLRHLEFFKVGAQYRERCFLAGNRVGKSTAGAYETTAHLTGLYPAWWVGRRFKEPVTAWACAKTFETARDPVQLALLGSVADETGRKVFNGKGFIPPYLTGRITWRSEDLADTVLVKHVTGGWSRLTFKAYEQRRRGFEGTARHVIWLDEECPLDIYNECLIRTATTQGIMMLTFTPLDGLTETVMEFMLDVPKEFSNAGMVSARKRK